MTSDPLSDALKRGLHFHKLSELDQALNWYRAAIALSPDDAEANSLLGLAFVHAGRADEGTSYLLRAVELEHVRPLPPVVGAPRMRRGLQGLGPRRPA